MVIRHQPRTRTRRAVEVVAQKFDVTLAVGVRVENVLTIIALVGDVVGDSRLDKAGAPRRAR